MYPRCHVANEDRRQRPHHHQQQQPARRHRLAGRYAGRPNRGLPGSGELPIEELLPAAIGAGLKERSSLNIWAFRRWLNRGAGDYRQHGCFAVRPWDQSASFVTGAISAFRGAA